MTLSLSFFHFVPLPSLSFLYTISVRHSVSSCQVSFLLWGTLWWSVTNRWYCLQRDENSALVTTVLMGWAVDSVTSVFMCCNMNTGTPMCMHIHNWNTNSEWDVYVNWIWIETSLQVYSCVLPSWVEPTFHMLLFLNSHAGIWPLSAAYREISSFLQHSSCLHAHQKRDQTATKGKWE